MLDEAGNSCAVVLSFGGRSCFRSDTMIARGAEDVGPNFLFFGIEGPVLTVCCTGNATDEEEAAEPVETPAVAEEARRRRERGGGEQEGKLKEERVLYNSEK